MVISPKELILLKETAKLRDEIERQLVQKFDGKKVKIDLRGFINLDALKKALEEFEDAGWGVRKDGGDVELYVKD